MSAPYDAHDAPHAAIDALRVAQYIAREIERLERYAQPDSPEEARLCALRASLARLSDPVTISYDSDQDPVRR